MGLLFSKKGSVISQNFRLIDDLPQAKVSKGVILEVCLYDEYLELAGLKKPLTLNYSQITDIYYGVETEIVQKNKSVIGRAVAGGLLLGGVGATVGAISGTGKKEEKHHKFLFIISYTSSSGQDAFLKFEDISTLKGLKLANKLKELCNIKDALEESSTQL